MRIFVKAQRKMPLRFGRVTCLLERTQHKVRKDALFRLARNLSNEPLIMLRRDAQITSGERNTHGALAALAIGIGPSRSRRSGDTPVAHGDFPLMQILDPERVAESASQFFEFEDFARVGLFMDTMKRP